MSDPFTRIVGSMLDAEVRFLVIGVWGVNYYSRSSGTLFTTQDRDLFLQPDPSNLLTAWNVCNDLDLSLWRGDEPLDSPRDESLAHAVVARRAVTTAIDASRNLQIDLSLVMAGFTFDEVWPRRRSFIVDGVSIPVASLSDIVRSKAAAGREKDRLFLATHEDAIQRLFRDHSPDRRD